MLDQFYSINQAAEIVVGTVGTPQERLAEGFKAFRRAAIFSSDWPPNLWEKYDCICGTLLAGGTWQKTIDRMGPKTAGECTTEISEAMKDLAVAVELASRNAGTAADGNNSAVTLAPIGEELKEHDETNAANRE